MSYDYLSNPKTPSIDELLDDPLVTVPFSDPTVSDLTYGAVLGLLYKSDYGKLLAGQDLRYAGSFGYSPRELMAYEFGLDANPVGHNFATFAHVHNAIKIEETRGVHRLDPRQKDVTLIAAATHDAVEGVVGDVRRGGKTPDFVAREADERWKMFTGVFASVLPSDFLQDVDDIVGHRVESLEHDFFELGHALTQFSTGMRVSRMCLALKDADVDVTPLPRFVASEDRRKKMCGMAVEVINATSADLRLLAEKEFWIAKNTLVHHRDNIARINEELEPLAA